jgi:hypothetical protein
MPSALPGAFRAPTFLADEDAVSGLNDASYSIADAHGVEVDEEAKPAIRELEVGEELYLMQRVQFLHGLDLDHHDSADQHIQS